jgi:hypothetical protein
MAVVTHGLKDSIDQILEITRSLERSIESMTDSAPAESSTKHVEALTSARGRVLDLKQAATSVRDSIEDLRRTKA